MPDHVRLRMPIAYPVVQPARGSQRPRETLSCAYVSVDVPMTAASETPVAISFGKPEERRIRTHGGGLQRLHLDRRGETFRPGMEIEGVESTFGILYPEGGPLTPAQTNLLRRSGSLPEGYPEADASHPAVAAAIERARGLVFVDGALWRPTEVPRLNLSQRNQAKWKASNSDGRVGDSLSFVASGIEPFRELVKAFESRSGMSVEGEFFGPELFDWYVDEPEAGPNAAFMAGVVIGSCGDAIGSLPASFIRGLVPLARVREALAGEPSPEGAREVYAILGRVVEMIGNDNYAWARKHALNGIAAIEASRDFRDHTLEADDIFALEAGL